MNTHNSSSNPNGSSAPHNSASDLSGLIAIRAAIFDGTGYADEARGIIFGLFRAGVRMQVQPLGLQHDTQNLLSTEEREIVETLRHQGIDIGRGVYFQHCPAHDFNPFLRCRHLVGRTMYETDSIPDGWREHCEAMDEVWVPSRFNCDTFASAGVSRDRLHALPGGIETDLFHPDAEPFAIPQRRGFNFLSVFEWTDRKGVDILLRAYLQEFKPSEDVALILKTYGRPDAHADLLPRLAYLIERQIGARLEDAAPVILLTPDFLSAAEMPRLYACANVFVLPTRGEGWGRPFMEALSCGVPVIATGWSGHLDFLTENISHLLDSDVQPVPWNNDVELSAGHKWAEVRVDHLRELMRRVYEQRDETRQMGHRARAEMIANWQWDSVIGKHWIPEFRRLLS